MGTEKRHIWRAEVTERIDQDDPRATPLLELLGLDPNEVEAGPGIAVSYTLLRVVDTG